MASFDRRENMDRSSSGKAHPVTHTHTPTPLQLVTQHLKSVFPISPLILAERAPKSFSPAAGAKGIKTAAHVGLALLAAPNQATAAVVEGGRDNGRGLAAPTHVKSSSKPPHYLGGAAIDC